MSASFLMTNEPEILFSLTYVASIINFYLKIPLRFLSEKTPFDLLLAFVFSQNPNG